MKRDQFRQAGYQFIDFLADYFEEVENYPVCSPVSPGEIKSRLPESPPMTGEGIDRIFADFKRIIMPGVTHWQHPSWFAYFPANNSPPSVLAELITAGIGAQCMLWQTSPSATELEQVVMEWLRQMLGLPEGMEGVIQDTASTATLCAILTARERATGFVSNREGLNSGLRVYASSEAHSSVEKAVKIAGIGKENLRRIRVDGNYAMVIDDLEEAIAQDIRDGYRPACVVATLGTTSSTAIDPLDQCARVCQKYGVWLHVDAAFAGTALVLPGMRFMIDGIEQVDSFVFNPHKWMLTNFDCSAYYVKDPSLLRRTFEIHPEYLRTGVDESVVNYRDYGVQLGRRFRGLKLWFVLRSYGVEGIRSMVREHLRLAQLFEAMVQRDRRFEVMAPVPLSLVCFRLVPDDRREELIDEANRELLTRVNSTGKVFLTHTTLGGHYALRMAIGQRGTEERHVREAWRLISDMADSLLVV